MTRRHATLKAWAIAAALMLAFAVKGLLLVPPASDKRAEFDTARAIGRLERILGDQRPHSVDTAANDAVRERLITELRALGVQPVVRTAPNCNGLPGFRSVSCSLTRNVVAVIGADRPGKALLLNAHYDSTPAGPGASDDGIGVATLLEVAANLQKTPPAQPVILLFNEGEEFGLNGAAAFAQADPLATSVGSLINVEARGVSGPAWMFETSEPNGPAIAAFEASSDRPYANSLTADFAKLIPNYTDVVVFKDGRQWRTLSFAVVGNEARYHTPGDRVEWLDRSSLHHLGSQVLAATKTLPSADDGSQQVYADIAGRLFFSLPFVVAEILLGLLLGGATFIALRQRAFGRPLLACAAAFVAAIIVAFVASWIAGFIRPGDYWRAYPLVAYLALYSGVVAVMTIVLAMLARKARRNALRAACWFLILALGGLLSLFVHGAMVFFILAPILALIGLSVKKFRVALLWAAAILHFIMFGQLAASIEMLLIDGPLWAVAPIAALAALPVLVEIARLPVRRLAIALAVLSLTLWVAALSMPRSSAASPAAFTIDYVRDDDSGKAHWGIASKQAPLAEGYAKLGRWEVGTLPHNGRRRWISAAPMLETPAATVTAVGDFRSANARRLRLRIAANGADAVMLRFSKDVPVRALGLPGRMRPIPVDKDEPASLRCSGRSCDGLEVEVDVGAAAPVELTVISSRFALPPQGQPLQAERARNAHPQYGTDSSYRVASVKL